MFSRSLHPLCCHTEDRYLLQPTLQESAEVSIYPQYDNTGGVDSERTFVKQIVQKFCDDGSSDDLFNEDEMAEATEDTNS